jgi:NAD(P)-dependent dehydrogenase (short-subunit alcohol dehydrogenase family)
MHSLEGKKAFVCGSTQGIGRACAMEFARLGAQVTLIARHLEGLETVQAELPTPTSQSHDVMQVDFMHWDALQRQANDYVVKRGFLLSQQVLRMPIAHLFRKLCNAHRQADSQFFQVGGHGDIE